MKKIRIYTLANFKRVFHLSQETINRLVKKRIIELQQSGFLGHSLAHNKIVIVRKFELLRFFMRNNYFSFQMEKSAKRISETIPVNEEEKEIFDFVGYQEAILYALPNNIEINENVVGRIMDFIMDCIPNVEEDKNFEMAKKYAEIFLAWENKTYQMEEPIPSPNELKGMEE